MHARSFAFSVSQLLVPIFRGDPTGLSVVQDPHVSSFLDGRDVEVDVESRTLVRVTMRRETSVAQPFLVFRYYDAVSIRVASFIRAALVTICLSVYSSLAPPLSLVPPEHHEEIARITYLSC